MDVVFETQGGEFSIELGYWDTVLEIKEKINKYHGVPVAKQTLIFNGQVLADDESDVDKCLILDNSRIQLLVSAGDDGGEDSSASKRVRLLKQEEAPPPTSAADPAGAPRNPPDLRSGTPDPQLPQEIANSSVRDSDHQVPESNSNSNINSASDPHQARPASSNGNRKMRVMVLPKSGNGKVAVEVSANDNVGELRKELQRLNQRLHFQLPQEGYFFIYKQFVMDEDRTFRWHQVAPGDTIEIFNGSVTGGS